MSNKKSGDLFGFLNKMNQGDYDYVDQMSNEEIKALAPFVLLMWCNGAKTHTVEHTIMTDAICNDKVFSLSRHPRLLLKLFVAANEGFGGDRYAFKKATGADKSSVTKLICEHYQCTYQEAKDYQAILSEDDIKKLKEMYA